MARLSKKEIAQLDQLITKKKKSKGLTNELFGAIFALIVTLVTTVVQFAYWAAVKSVTKVVIPLMLWMVQEGGKGLREMATGKHRGAFLPVWPTLAALLPLPWAGPGWLALGSAFAGTWVAIWATDHEFSLAEKLPGRAIEPIEHLGTAARGVGRLLRATWTRAVGRKVFSNRELLLVATYCEAVGIFQVIRGLVPAWGSLAVLVVLGLYPVCLWVDGRRIRPPAKLTQFQETWNLLVPKRLPEMAGTWLSWDDKKHQGVWELDDALANEVREKSDEIELALSHEMPEIRRGSLELKHNKRDHVRHLRVRYTSDPIGDASKTTYFEGPTLDKEGRYLAGITPGGLAIQGRLYRKGGAAFSIVIGATGAGKGVIFRTMLANAFSSPNVFCVAVDGKGGTGIPWARLGADMYAWTPEQWALAIEMTYEILQARKLRYGKVGKDQWSPFTPLIPGEPCDPLFFLPVDEIQEVVKAWPARSKRGLTAKVETLSAQGRSVGVSGALSTQFGMVTDYWNNIIRTNFMGGGTTFVGKVGSRQSKQTAIQDQNDVDPSTLPDHEGWFLPISRIDTSVPRDAFRGVFLPTEADRVDGDPAPFGVAEEVIPKIVKWATLHPDDQAIVDRYRNRWESTDSGLVVPEQGNVMLHSVPTVDGDGTDDGESRVLKALAEASLNASQLHREIDMNRSYLSHELLPRLEAEGKITRDDDGRTWRRVA